MYLFSICYGTLLYIFQIYAEIGGHIQTQRLEIYYNNYLYNVVLLLYIINYITYLVYKLLEEGGYGK